MLRRNQAGYWVVFDRLAEVVRAKSVELGLATAAASDGLPGQIVSMASLDDVTVSVTVRGASEGTGTLVMSSAEVDPVNWSVPWGSTDIAMRPDDYRPQLIWANSVHRPLGLAENATVDCFSDALLEFDVGSPPKPRLPGRPDSIVITTRGIGRTMSIGDRGSRSTDRIEISANRLHLFRAQDHGIPVVLPGDGSWEAVTTMYIDDPGTVSIDLEDLMHRSPLQEMVIAEADDVDGGGLPMGSLISSEEPDPIGDGMLLGDDVSLLTVMAASALLDTTPYEDLVEPFPTFDGLTEDTSGLVVVLPTGLAGSITVDDRTPLELQPFIHLDQQASRTWMTLEPGPHVLRIEVNSEATVVRTVALPGRATIVAGCGPTVSGMHQLALPPGHLLPPGVDRSSLVRDVQFSAFVQSHHADGRPVDADAIGEEAHPQLQRVEVGDWPDPITVCAALWDRARHIGARNLGESFRIATNRVEEVAPRSMLSDLRVLTELAGGLPLSEDSAPPLLLAAALARPLPPDPEGFALDYTGPWVAWKVWPSSERASEDREVHG